MDRSSFGRGGRITPLLALIRVINVLIDILWRLSIKFTGIRLAINSRFISNSDAQTWIYASSPDAHEARECEKNAPTNESKTRKFTGS